MEFKGMVSIFKDGSIGFKQYYDKTYRKLERQEQEVLKIRDDKFELRVASKAKQYIFRFSKESYRSFL